MKQEGQLEPIPSHFTIEAAKQSGRFSMKEEHFHDAWEIYYLVSGERCYFIKDKTYHIRQGNLVLISKNVLHKTSAAGRLSMPHERILVNFQSEAILGLPPEKEEEIGRLFSGFPVIRLNAEEQEIIQPFLSRMLLEQKEKRAGYEDYSRLLLSQLLLTLFRLTENRSDYGDEAEEGKRPFREITEAAQYINAHYGEGLSLGGLASRFHISASYLSHLFPRVTGMTLVTYINNVRIEKACVLLRETELAVTEIGYRVGYQSVTHFGRMFKNFKGASPQEYRRELRLFR